jgi:transposase
LQRHRHSEFIRFLNAVERQVPAGKVIHAVLDNYATHKHPRVLAWLARHPRWTFHFTPTSASWLNAIENFFSKMTRQRIRRGIFRAIADLQAAINAYLAEHNASPIRAKHLRARRIGNNNPSKGGQLALKAILREGLCSCVCS